jgi:entericidin B
MNSRTQATPAPGNHHDTMRYRSNGAAWQCQGQIAVQPPGPGCYVKIVVWAQSSVAAYVGGPGLQRQGGVAGRAKLAALMLSNLYHAQKDDTMRKNVTLALTLLAVIGLAPLLGACQTAAGAGQDISAGGRALTNSAEKHAP